MRATEDTLTKHSPFGWFGICRQSAVIFLEYPFVSFCWFDPFFMMN